MITTYKKHTHNFILKNFFRAFSALFILIGSSILIYIISPFISWHLYFSPVFASGELTIPIPKTTIVSKEVLGSIVENASSFVNGVDYKNAKTWFPAYQAQDSKNAKILEYSLTIPKLKITDAVVSTTDYNLGQHLVHYGGTNLPPNPGNAVIFGHSTLPQLFNPKDYTTIFANAYKLQVDDTISVRVENVSYTYKIKIIRVVDPSDTTIFAQSLDNSYLTLVTCTPPGTTWKRLVIKGVLEKI